MSMTTEQMRQQIEQQQRQIDAMAQTHKALEQEMMEATEWLAMKMADAFVLNAKQLETVRDTDRKKRRMCSTSDNDMPDDVDTPPTPCTRRRDGQQPWPDHSCGLQAHLPGLAPARA
jgi:hypothetical protein